MTESKYNTLKGAISQLSEVYKNDPAMQALTEIVAEVDKLEGNETAKETDLMDKNEWFSLSYMERIELKQSNPKQFKNSMAGKFKGGK